MTSNTIGSSSKVVISTIQRVYSILKAEADLDPELEEHSISTRSGATGVLPVVYKPAVPPEFFDIIFIDECHRSIYSLWRQVPLTATPAKHTYGFFNQNVVMEYPHAQAVADGVNCDYEVYRIRTRMTLKKEVTKTGRRKRPATAGAVRHLPGAVQPGAAASSARHGSQRTCTHAHRACIAAWASSRTRVMTRRSP